MKYQMYNKEDLRKRLEKLTGEDFNEAERVARISGDQSLDIIMSRCFYAALAARAYKVPLEDIKALSVREYAAITGDVGGFLIVQDAEAEVKPRKPSEKSA